jgi:hypothetical protein
MILISIKDENGEYLESINLESNPYKLMGLDGVLLGNISSNFIFQRL